jgi:hypothetical protein
MGNKYARRFFAVVMALVVVMTSGIFVFAADSPTIGKINNVTSYGHESEGTMDVYFDPVQGAAKYRIYVNGKLVTETTSTTALLTGLKIGEFLDIFVAAVDANGKESEKVETPTSKRWFKRTKIKKAKGGKKKVTVTWKKVSGATGYVIQIKKKGGEWKTVKTVGKTTKATIKKLKKGKYYARVRALNGEYLGIYSAAKYFKVK